MVTVLLMADKVHFVFFGELISVSELSYAWQVGSVIDSIYEKLHLVDLLYYCDVLVATIFIILYLFYVKSPARVSSINSRLRRKWSAGLVASGMLAAIPAASLIYRDPDKVFEWRYARVQFVGVMGVVPYHFFDLATHLSTFWTRSRVTALQREQLREFLTARRETLRDRSPLFGVAHGRNIIVVQAESLHSFPVGLRLNGESVTPNLDAFASESLSFVNFYDQTWLGATSDSLFISLQSLYPLGQGEGVIATRYLTNQYRGLPAILSEQGYSTVAAMGAPGRYWNIGEMERKLGFQRTYFDDSYPKAERFGQGVADGEFFTQTIPLLQAQAEPFMALLISVSNHHPYNLPESHRTLKLGFLEGTLVGRYLDSVHYFDHAFGEFVARLRQTGILEKSVVVLYGDHQGWLEEPPELARLLGFSEQSKYDQWKARKKVPLLIRLPRGQHAGVKTIFGGHLDTSPTLLSLLGLTANSSVMLGFDLTRETDTLVVFRDGSFAETEYYFINAPELGSDPVCYRTRSDQQFDCALIESRRQEALERLRISDLIIRGDLVPTLSHGNNG
jgi:phosphoglycerol transferase MdoB-like AlkP superfamily enzyme